MSTQRSVTDGYSLQRRRLTQVDGRFPSSIYFQLEVAGACCTLLDLDPHSFVPSSLLPSLPVIPPQNTPNSPSSIPALVSSCKFAPSLP